MHPRCLKQNRETTHDGQYGNHSKRGTCIQSQLCGASPGRPRQTPLTRKALIKIALAGDEPRQEARSAEGTTGVWSVPDA